jgi:peptidyl-prolyl cis-trans isomerase SurA
LNWRIHWPVALSFMVAALFLHAETIDRIAVSVGNRVITTSDIERQIRVSAFLSGTKPDLSLEARRKAADAMVDQKLIRSELEASRYPEPAPAELDTAYAEFKNKYFKTDEEYRRALAEYGITEADAKEQLHWQRTFAAFVSLRFRAAVQVNDQDVQDYFDKTVAPAARAAKPDGSITLDEFRDQIRAKLTGDREDQQMNQWLAESRRRTAIVYHEEAFR